MAHYFCVENKHCRFYNMIFYDFDYDLNKFVNLDFNGHKYKKIYPSY